MNNISFFLAQRMLFTSKNKKTIATMSTICFFGIFIGSFSLTIVTAIMRGFEIVVHNKIQGIHSHIIIDSYGKPINFKTLSCVLENEFPEICAFSPHTERNALIKCDTHTDSMPTVIIIKSIDPDREMHTSSLFSKIIKPININHFNTILGDETIIIGKQYAISHNLNVGDTIELLFTQEKKVKGRTVTFDSQKVFIGGIFDTGIDDFDSNVIYCSFSFLKNIFSHSSVEQVNIKLHHNVNESAVIQKLRARLGLSVYSWKDLYPSLVSTLKLEKYVSFFVIALILLVASMNIISFIHMQVTQKRTEIAILKSIGMNNYEINTIFFIAGLFISISASLCGIFTAILASYCITKYPFISLPDTYYATHLPIALETDTIISVLLIVFFLSICAIYFSTRQIRLINISHVLRFEK